MTTNQDEPMFPHTNERHKYPSEQFMLLFPPHTSKNLTPKSSLYLFLIFIIWNSTTHAQESDSISVRAASNESIQVISDSLQLRDKADKGLEKILDPKNTALSFEEMGLIVDETQTKLGHDFYEIFYANWQPPEVSVAYTIVISEKPVPRSGTQVSITINDVNVFDNFLQPKYDAIEEVALYAVEYTGNYLSNFEAIQQDLQGNDMVGSGIF